jgi:hypothetical protein
MKPGAAFVVLLLAAAVQVSRPAPAQPQPQESAADALQLLNRLESAWKARDLETYLSLWVHSTLEQREEEARFALEHWAAEQSEIQIDRPFSVPSGQQGLVVSADIFSIREPRGRVEQWLLSLARRGAGFALIQKELTSHIDGLVHLSLDPKGYRAAGLALRFEDFELRMSEGTLFTSPESLGPTLLVFVGRGEVLVRPKPEAEREQLRQFCGRPELLDRVRAALARIHPADLRRVIDPLRLEPDPDAAKRLPAAERLFRDQGSRAFVLDAAAPRSPWWLLPGLGDSAITFETGRRGTLTFTVNDSDPESISLFDRQKRVQICLYPKEGGITRYSEDEGRAADILGHDLRVRIDPAREFLQGEDTLAIRMLQPTNTLRLRLDDAFRVESISSPEAGRHLFFRVRNQDTLMVSLGGLAGRIGDLSLTVRYAGVLGSTIIEQEALQAEARMLTDEDIPIERVLVYTNRNAWYPQGVTEDYAVARTRFEVPPGYVAVTGGRRESARAESGRVAYEYVQEEPGKYITVAVGRMAESGSAPGDPPLQAYAVSRQRGEAPGLLKLSRDIIAFFTEEFGRAPYSELSLVITEAPAPGGHSPPGMVLMQHRPALLRGTLRDDPASFPEAPNFFLAHELAHQWWGHGVSGQNYRERWLSEALAHYAAALWTQRTRGETAFQSVLRQMSRWAIKHTSRGPINLGYRLGHVKSDPQIFRAVVYDKGAYVLHMLRAIVGPEAFRAALREIQEEKRYQKIGTDDLREALEAASGLSLGAYFDAWVMHTQLPEIRFKYKVEATRTTVEATVRDLPGPVPLEIALTHSGERTLRKVRLEPAGGSWTFETPEPVSRVELNSDRGLLAVVKKS